MDTGAVILTTFLSTIPVYLFFATGFYLRHKQVIQADHDAPIMRIAMDVAYPCLVFHSIMKYMVLSGNETLSSVSFSLQAIAAGPWNFCWASRPHGWSRKCCACASARAFVRSP
mgnify:CR=1 FL=1